jgi:hypothetical protein
MNIQFPSYKIERIKKGSYRFYRLTSQGKVWEGPVRTVVINTFMAEVARMQGGTHVAIPS